MQTMTRAALAIVGILASGAGHAALEDRGGGLLYDTVLNVTWLQDASYAKNSGYDADGRMTWANAKTWADNLSFVDTVRGVTWSDWRLPTVNPVNGSTFNYSYSTSGTTDTGYNITSPNSEMAYMYYVNLGLTAHTPGGGGILGFPVNGTNVGPVTNLQYLSAYWSGSAYAPDPTGSAFYFDYYDGSQSYGSQLNERSAWAVRSGDVGTVAAVPEPETYAMLMAGLALVSVVARRRGRFASA